MFNPLLFAQLKSDLVKEVAYTRRKQHQASLQYYCALNALQYRKRVAMLEPMLGYTQAQVLNSFCPTNWARTHYHISIERDFHVGTDLVYKGQLLVYNVTMTKTFYPCNQRPEPVSV